MKRKHGARSPPTTRNIPELGISESIPLTEYFPFRVLTPCIQLLKHLCRKPTLEDST